MKILIIEDEMNAYDILRKRIQKLLSDVEIVAHLKTVVEAVNWFRTQTPVDLIFLDVELADGKSFEIFKHEMVNAPVIFTTAYDQYALKAFGLNSVDYLLKPISEEDLTKAIQKFHRMQSTFGLVQMEQLKKLIHTPNTKKRNRFLINSGEKYFFVKASEIAYCYAEDGLTFLKTIANKRHLINETLDGLEQELNQEQFFRINRHQIINIEVILTIHEYFNRRFKLELLPHLTDHEFVVSRLRRGAFKKWMNGQ